MLFKISMGFVLIVMVMIILAVLFGLVKLYIKWVEYVDDNYLCADEYLLVKYGLPIFSLIIIIGSFYTSFVYL